MEIDGLTGTIRLEGRWLWLGDDLLLLNPRQRDVMDFMMRHPNEVFTTEQIVASVWGGHYRKNNASVQLLGLRRLVNGGPCQLRLVGRAAASGHVLITKEEYAKSLDRFYHKDGRRKK